MTECLDPTCPVMAGILGVCNREHCDRGMVKLKVPEARILKYAFTESSSEIHRNGRGNAKGSLHHYCQWKTGMASHRGMEATTQWT